MPGVTRPCQPPVQAPAPGRRHALTVPREAWFNSCVDVGRVTRVTTFDFTDNITTSRRGTLVVCEDSLIDNYIRGLSRGGQLWDIALNRLVSQLTGLPRFGDEFAGSTFSPDGHTLFVNIQASRGMTFAIWGPWRKIGV